VSCARHLVGLLLSVACNFGVSVHAFVGQHLPLCSSVYCVSLNVGRVHMLSVWISVNLQTRGRCSLHYLRYRVAGAAASFQPEFAWFRQGLDRSDETISLSQILSDVKDITR